LEHKLGWTERLSTADGKQIGPQQYGRLNGVEIENGTSFFCCPLDVPGILGEISILDAYLNSSRHVADIDTETTRGPKMVLVDKVQFLQFEGIATFTDLNAESFSNFLRGEFHVSSSRCHRILGHDSVRIQAGQFITKSFLAEPETIVNTNLVGCRRYLYRPFHVVGWQDVGNGNETECVNCHRNQLPARVRARRAMRANVLTRCQAWR
jgi:hypothetical protein